MSRTIRVVVVSVLSAIAVSVIAVVTAGAGSVGAAAGDPQVVQVATGPDTTCEVLSNGFVRCWGENTFGEAGSPRLGDVVVPVEVPQLSDVVEVGVGLDHTCALIGAGSVLCWGSNSHDQLGNTSPDTSVPTLVAGLSGVVDISVTELTTCALSGDGLVRCFGYDDDWILGVSTFADESSPTPLTVVGVSDAVAIATGRSSACALIDDGTVMCWGGAYGNGRNIASPDAEAIAGITDATAITMGDDHGCVIRASDQVSCWGYNGPGALGLDPEVSTVSITPHTTTHTGVVALTAGGTSTCAVLEDGSMECWGNNLFNGILGNGTTTSSHVPTDVVGLTDVSAADMSFQTACAVEGGATMCWGDNSTGQLRAPRADQSPWPGAVALPDGVTEIDVYVKSGCAVVESTVPSDDGVWCWGANNAGQRGNGTTSATPDSIPTRVNGLEDAIDVEVGFAFACALLSTDGSVSCWGSDTKGALGNGGPGSTTTPTPVIGVTGASQLAVGSESACVLYPDGTVWCWGSASAVGTGDGLTHQATPVQVTALSEIRSIDVDGYNGCAVSNTDDAWCWGSRASGQLGNGTASPGSSITPVQVTVASDIASISTSGSHTCAVETDGDLVCFGSNLWGQIGNGSASNTAVAAGFVVPDIGDTASVTAGGMHTCAVSTTGVVHCFGYNEQGALGTGGYENASSPVVSPALVSPLALAAGFGATCAIVPAGPVCFGTNTEGQLGNDGIATSFVPVTADALPVPGTPTAATLASGNGSLTLSFTAPPAVADAAVVDYVVQRRVEGTTAWTTVSDGISTTTGATLTGLTNGTRYQVRVAARSASYTGSFTAVVTRAAGVPPSAPRSLTASPGDGRTVLAWTAPAQAATTVTDYVVQFRRAGASTWSTFNDGVRATRTATVTGLTNGTRYEFRVSAKNAVGQSDPSTAVSATPRTAPTAPRNLSAGIARGAVALTWRAPSSNGGAAITDYAVQYRKAGSKKWKTFADGVGTSVSARVTGLDRGVEFQFRVRALNPAGKGPWSNTVRATAP